MHLIQLLLPLYDNDRRPVGNTLHAQVKDELSERFGGLTAYTRAPAEGRWQDGAEKVYDEMVIYEVMVDTVDAEWWLAYRHTLEARFRQGEIVIRALPMSRL